MLLKPMGFMKAAVAAASETCVFNTTTHVDYSADAADGPGFVFAARVTRTAASDSYLFASGGSGDSALILRDGDDDLRITMEYSTGARLASFVDTGFAIVQDSTYSIFCRFHDGDSEIVVDNGTPWTDTATWPTANVKVPKVLNNSLDDPDVANRTGLTLVGGMWMAVGSAVSDPSTGLSYSDFFDGSDLPTFGTGNVGTFPPDFAETTIAGFNAYAGTTGTVT